MEADGKRLGTAMKQVVPPTPDKPWYRIRFISGNRVKEIPKNCFECNEVARIFAFERFLCLTHAVEAQMIENGEPVIETPEDAGRRKHRVDRLRKVK